jgi:hypothetical protein
MIIRMAIEAGGSHTQIRSAACFLSFFNLDQLRFMASLASQRTMLAYQLKPGIPVLKLQGVEPHDFKGPSMMLIMAGKTFPAFDVGGGMITPVHIDQFLDLLMALEAFGRRYLFPQFMAFDAIGHPLQARMSSGQITGGNLSQTIPGNEQKEYEQFTSHVSESLLQICG